MCPMDLIAKLTFLHIASMWSLKDKVLFITIPKFLAFALIPIALFANVKVSNDLGCVRPFRCRVPYHIGRRLRGKSRKQEHKRRNVNLLEKVLRNEKSHEREVQNIELTKLNKHLADCIRSVRRKDGEDYEPSSLSLKKINKNLNLTMYTKNTIPYGKCFVQYLRTSLFS